jgi:serine protease inhibitor
MNKPIKILLSMATITAMIGIGSSTLAQEPNKQLLGELDGSMAKNTAQVLPCKSTDFSFKLFEQLTRISNDNVVISPFSAYAALSMCLNGAAGSTREQMAKVLGISTSIINSLNERNKAIFDSIANGNHKVQLEIANAIYSDTGIPFKQSFLNLCRQMYNAELNNVDFNNPATVANINAWCKNKTHGKIPTIVGKLTRNEKMVILNAVYFKGTWASPFKKVLTQDDEFTTLAGDKTSIKMMHQLEHLSYFKNNHFQAVAIPYKGNRQSLYIFLPDKKIQWPLFLAEFTHTNWHEWTPKFSDVKVDLSLPRFTVKYSQDLSPALAEMGMAKAFDPKQANFSYMLAPPGKAWISRVLQKTFMDVNEEGTEAAAATAVIMGATMAVHRQAPPIEFRVDRPFVLALVDNNSKEILFLGSILQP